MGGNQSKKEDNNISDTIGWNNVKTENFSASKKIYNKGN